ncbi:MAG: M20 family metallo-hydrolase [Acidimicrobiia bacterium]
MTHAATGTRPSIDRDRLLGRLAALAALSPLEGAGSCRLALTDADKAGRDLLCTWMTDLGLDVRIDVVGNIVGVWTAGAERPDEAPVLCGSHIDTVATGGRYDGAYGVLAGVEVIETLAAAGVRTRRPLAVGAFTNEEGARFAPDMMGSLVYVGGLSAEEALDTVGIDGARVGDELARIGYQGVWPVPAAAPHAFVELHIEQGPVLEHEGYVIGAVTGVQGISWQELTFTGQSNHAGTTPMHLRRDPAYAAARVATFVRELARELGGRQVATVGRILLHPNLVNVVPAWATMTVDLRNTDAERLREAEARLAAFVATIAREEQLSLSVRSLARFEPVDFDERVIALVESTAIRHGWPTLRLPSGAGHDAQMLARVCPVGMIFVPSHRGISHNPAEHTDAGHLHAGADVLLDVLLELADR